MDRKARSLLEGCLRKIAAGDFDERDLSYLLIALRGSAATTFPIRELADFVAHRERDRGLISEYVEQVRKDLDAGRTPSEIRPVFTLETFKTSLRSILNGEGFLELSAERLEQLFVCVVLLLQDVTLIARQGGAISGTLRLALTKSEILLHGEVRIENRPGVTATFDALTVPNRYYVGSLNDTFPVYQRRIMYAEIVGGSLSLRYVSEKADEEEWIRTKS